MKAADKKTADSEKKLNGCNAAGAAPMITWLTRKENKVNLKG